MGMSCVCHWLCPLVSGGEVVYPRRCPCFTALPNVAQSCRWPRGLCSTHAKTRRFDKNKKKARTCHMRALFSA